MPQSHAPGEEGPTEAPGAAVFIARDHHAALFAARRGQILALHRSRRHDDGVRLFALHAALNFHWSLTRDNIRGAQRYSALRFGGGPSFASAATHSGIPRALVLDAA